MSDQATDHAANCRHRCPECRMGLGTHLACDPLCEARDQPTPTAYSFLPDPIQTIHDTRLKENE